MANRLGLVRSGSLGAKRAPACKAGKPAQVSNAEADQGRQSAIMPVKQPWNWLDRNLSVTISPVSYQIKELLMADGHCPFSEWFGSLESVAAAKVTVAVSRLEMGNLSNFEWFRGIGEYKIDWGPGLRIYLTKEGLNIIILVGGGTKKRQQRDIDQAVALWEDYKRRKASTQKGK